MIILLLSFCRTAILSKINPLVFFFENVYLFLATLSLRSFRRPFSSRRKLGSSLDVERGLPTAGASLVENGLQELRLR